MISRLLLAVGLTVIALPAHAAGDAQDRARGLNDDGKAAFDLGSYDEAIERFTDAYKIYPDARILFNLAQAYRRKHEYARALELYRTYLRNQPDAVNRQVVEALVPELETLIAKQKSTDDHPPQGTASTALAPLPTVVTKIEEPRPWYTNVAGWTLVGGGAVSAGVGIAFFVSAGSLEDQLAVAPESERAGLRSDISTPGGPSGRSSLWSEGWRPPVAWPSFSSRRARSRGISCQSAICGYRLRRGRSR